MDEKTALKVLGLTRPVGADELKKVFRAMAKRYHPDFSVASGLDVEKADARMKQINMAFGVLACRCPARPVSKPEASGGPERARPGKSFFSKIAKNFKQRTKIKPVQQDRFSSNKPPVRKPKDFRPNKGRRITGFDQVLAQSFRQAGISCQNDPAGPSRIRVKPSASPYENYMKHMALKERVETRKRILKQDLPDRIEKISPVRKSNGVKP